VIGSNVWITQSVPADTVVTLAETELAIPRSESGEQGLADYQI
jgi:hypothetical protein